MKFRKKPVVIEAVQFTGEQPWPEGVYASSNPRERDTPVCWTLEGPLHVSVGDWIIQGVKGEFYPCKPDIFAATYEPAPSAAPPTNDEACPNCENGSGWTRHLGRDNNEIVEECHDHLPASPSPGPGPGKETK